PSSRTRKPFEVGSIAASHTSERFRARRRKRRSDGARSMALRARGEYVRSVGPAALAGNPLCPENAMRWTTLPLCAVALVACAKSEKAADTQQVAAAPAAAPAPAKLQLANVAGKWNMKVMNEAGDTTLV